MARKVEPVLSSGFMETLNREEALSARLRWLIAALLGVGAGLRVAQWAHGRELWWDESYLGVNLVAVSLQSIFDPIWGMLSPRGFTAILKACASCFGSSVYALRLPPLAAGLLTLPLFAFAARGYFRGRSHGITILLALAFVVFSKNLIYYSSELRHYGFDVAAACLVLALAMPRKEQPCGWPADGRQALIFAGVAMAAVWTSMAAVFVLAAVGLAQGVACAYARRWRQLGWVVLVSLIWSLCFVLHWKLLQRTAALTYAPSLLDNHIARLTVPFPPQSARDLGTWIDFARHFFYFPGGLYSAGLGAAVLTAGLLAALRRNAYTASLLCLPAVFVLAAGLLKQYPLRNQYVLFLLPCFYLLLAEGLGTLAQSQRRGWRWAGAVCAVAMLAHPIVQSSQVLWAYRTGPGGDACLRPLFAEVEQQWRDGDQMLAEHWQFVPFAYAAHERGWPAWKAPLNFIQSAPVCAVGQCRLVLASGPGGAASAANPPRTWVLTGLQTDTGSLGETLGTKVFETASSTHRLMLYSGRALDVARCKVATAAVSPVITDTLLPQQR